jgi:monofunctional chorismate mutase
MNKLEQSRILIDEIDSEIITLFEKRMEAVIEVIKYKIENNIPITDTNREIIMLEKNLNKIQNEEYKKYYKSVLDGFLKASKDMQKDILDAYK